MDETDLIITGDGSHSLRHAGLNETYHSVHGALQESIHVFIERGLDYFQVQHRTGEINVLEIGFGTGLNALLTLRYAMAAPVTVHYTTVESNPVGEETFRQLNYPGLIGIDDAVSLFQRLHSTAWDQEEKIQKNFTLTKHLARFQDFDPGIHRFDVVYFDAFAPSKQPELWERQLLLKVEQSMRPGAVFVTYCAKGQLKRDLRSMGLDVQTLPGPPGKKEMVRAVKS